MPDRRVDVLSRSRLETIVRGVEEDRAHLRRIVRGMTIALFVVAAACAGGFVMIRSEATARRNATCKLFEREHRKDVRQLRATYAYVEGLKPRQRSEGINPAVIASLPQTEEDARSSTEPSYCDLPGVGLPGGRVVLPHRPAGLESPPPRGAGRWARHT